MDKYNELLPRRFQKRKYKFITKSLAEVTIQNFLGDEWGIIPNTDEETFSVWAFNKITNKSITFVFENDFEIYLLKQGKHMEYNQSATEFAQQFLATKVYEGTSYQKEYIDALIAYDGTEPEDIFRILDFLPKNIPNNEAE